MKRTMLALLLAGSALTLGGCAAMSSTTPGYVEVIDRQKIILVERWARANNTVVIWVTAPTRKVPIASGT